MLHALYRPKGGYDLCCVCIVPRSRTALTTLSPPSIMQSITRNVSIRKAGSLDRTVDILMRSMR